jgi:hypothetical protein
MLVGGRPAGVFTVLSEHPLSSEVEESWLTLRDETAQALEAAALSENLSE